MVTTLPKDVVRRLVRARKLSGLSSRQLSLRAGVSDNFAAAIERGKNKAPAFGVILGFANVLGVSLDWLARGQGPEPTEDEIKAHLEKIQAEHEAQKARRAARTTKAAA